MKMNFLQKESEIVTTLLNDNAVKEKLHSIQYKCDIGRDLNQKPYQDIVFLKGTKEGSFFISYETTIEVGNFLQEILLHFAKEDKIYSDIEFEINPDGSYTSRYWFDEERLYKEEYNLAILRAKDFPHAAANGLVNYHFFEIKFKRKFTRIHWIFEVKNGEAFFDIYSINQRNQILPIELEATGVTPFNIGSEIVYFDKFWKYNLLEHYEATNNGILKDVWKPWNKIFISIPPNSYLNENEDIAYYLDDVKLEKDFFLRGY